MTPCWKTNVVSLLLAMLAWGDGYVIVVPWASRVYGICTLRVVICIPEGFRGNTYNYTKGTNPYTHGTGHYKHWTRGPGDPRTRGPEDPRTRRPKYLQSLA